MYDITAINFNVANCYSNENPRPWFWYYTYVCRGTVSSVCVLLRDIWAHFDGTVYKLCAVCCVLGLYSKDINWLQINVSSGVNPIQIIS